MTIPDKPLLHICCAPDDHAWVFGRMIPALGLVNGQYRTRADDALGELQLREVARAVEECRFTVLIASSAVRWDMLAQFAAELAQHAGLQQEAPRLIIVARDFAPDSDAERSRLLHGQRVLVGLDCSNESRTVESMARLRSLLELPVPIDAPPACPYPGLAPFTAAGRHLLFGRDRDRDAILHRIRGYHTRILVTAPSGWGKSSLIHGAVLPALDRRDHVVQSVLRGGDMAAALRGAIAAFEVPDLGAALDAYLTVVQGAADADVEAARSRLRAVPVPDVRRRVVVIDPLETIFASDAASRATLFHLLRGLWCLPWCTVILCVREDFFAALMADQCWSELKDSVYPLDMLDEAALRAAITEPARQTGVHIDAALVERLVREIDRDRSSSPLAMLQLVLKEMWARLRWRYLTLADYEWIVNGGQRGLAAVLAVHADAVVQSLTQSGDRVVAQHILCDLVWPGEGRPPTRRQRALEHLRRSDGTPGQLERVLERLVEGRLITASGANRAGPVVDLAHDALITGWATLAGWIDELQRDLGKERRPDVRPGEHAGGSSNPKVLEPTVPNVDIGILTIREDEFRAVLAVFSSKAGIFKGVCREYALRYADAAHGERYVVAVLRQIEQGNGEARDAARDLIDDLAPKLVLVVGIAGGLPSHELTLGDVIISTRIQDFTIHERKTGEEPTYAAAGEPVTRALAARIANLAARDEEIGDWTAELPPQPPVTWTKKGQLYGPLEWQRELMAKLERHHGKNARPRAPVYVAGPIGSSDRLIKDPALLFPWIATARNLLAVQMESGGVYRASREGCPILTIRGVSEIIGLKRTETWAKFACASAAAFTRAFLRTQPVPVGSSPLAAAGHITTNRAFPSKVPQEVSAMKLLAAVKDARRDRESWVNERSIKNGRSVENTIMPARSSTKTRCIIVIEANVKEFDADRLARAIDELRRLTGDISLRITDVEEGSVRLTVALSPAAAKKLVELRETGQLTQICGFDVSAVVELPTSEAAAGVVVALAPARTQRHPQVHMPRHLESGAFAGTAEPAASIALDWAGTNDPYRDIVHAPPKQPSTSRVNHPAEEAALMCVRRGQHKEALTILMNAYGAPITEFALLSVRNRELAKDIRQQVFLEAYQSFSNFESRSSLWSWLCSIAYHRCSDELRRMQRSAVDIADMDMPDELFGQLVPRIGEDQAARRRALEDCLSKLSASIRTPLLMRVLYGMSYAEIADVVGVSPGNIQIRISRALRFLQRCMREKGVGP